MLAAIHQLNTKENLAKVKMEEQTVPSAGFSPQPDLYDTEYKFIPQQQQNHHNNSVSHHDNQNQNQNNYGPILSVNSGMMEDSSSYCNLADTFDLSLLGDTYDDHDMATVPSPSAWSPTGASMEPTSWQQMSLYAASPDCMKPALSPVHYSSDSYLQISSPGTPGSVYGDMSCSSGGSSPVHHQQMGQMGQNQNQQQQQNNLLLRQCLEDTTFQRKYNFKPLELPTTSLMADLETREMGRTTPSSTSSSSENMGNALELNQIEPVFSMAFEQIRSDIQNVCSILAISPDPMQWSGQDVQSWLAHTLHSFTSNVNVNVNVNVNGVLQQFWNLDGCSLCSLDENEFRLRDMVSGDRLFSHLELWKMLQNQNQNSQQQGKNFSSPVQQQQRQRQTDVNFPINVNVNVNNVFNLEQLLLSPSIASPMPISSPATPCDGHTLTSHVPDILTSVSSPTSTTKTTTKPSISSGGSSINSSQQVASVSSPSLDNCSNAARSPSSSSNFSSPPEPMNTDDDDEEEEEEEEKKPVIVGKTKGTSPNGPKSGAHIHLWQFLKELLASPQQHGSCIRWLDQSRGVFKIEDSVRVARLWGLRKNRPAMNYDKLSRSIRQYYRKGIMRKTERSQRLVYQFCHPYGL